MARSDDSMLTAQRIEEHRPEVPERPDISCRVYWYGGRGAQWIVKQGDYGLVPRGAPYDEFLLPGTRLAELMERRDELVGELINQMRGAALVDKIDAIDAEIAALGEGT